MSGVADGGAPKSTLELARLLAARGHDIRVLLTKRPADSSLFDIATRAHIKSQRLPILGSVTSSLMGRCGRSVTTVSDEPNLRVMTGTVAENAAPQLIGEFPPDVVIANSLPRIGFARLADQLAGRIPLVLYMREAHSLTHMTVSGLRPDAIIANAREFCDQVADLGLHAHFVPSIIDLSSAATETTRRSVLMINPIAENRPDLFVHLARSRPGTHFVLQESWPLPATEFDALVASAATLPNLQVRHRFDSPADVYADAKLLVATYPTNRPRVVVEAQYNGIPVVVLGQSALVEAAGPMDTIVPSHASDDQWLAAVARYLDEPDFYEQACRSAAEWARRPEISPSGIVDDFEAAIGSVMGVEVA